MRTSGHFLLREVVPILDNITAVLSVGDVQHRETAADVLVERGIEVSPRTTGPGRCIEPAKQTGSPTRSSRCLSEQGASLPPRLTGGRLLGYGTLDARRRSCFSPVS